MTDVVEILERAKKRIEAEGWRQGPRFVHGQITKEYGEPPLIRRGCCALDALTPTEHSPLDGHSAAGALGEALTGDPLHFAAVMGWNDAPGRTVEDVYALYDAAIEIAKRRAGGLFAVTEAHRTDDEAAP